MKEGRRSVRAWGRWRGAETCGDNIHIENRSEQGKVADKCERKKEKKEMGKSGTEEMNI